MATDPIPFPQSPALPANSGNAVLGSWLVIGSALAWSFGGAIDRFVSVSDTWTVVFWRSVFACSFLIVFLVARDGRKAADAFRQMGWPGVTVALCFMTASISFVQAIALTSVANVILINATVPLAAALIAWLVLGERISGLTWAAIAAVICGVALMVSDSSGGAGALNGNLLALLITFVFAIATIVTRRYSGVRMTPAVILATALAAVVAFTQAGDLTVGTTDLVWLFAFGALNLGLGMALFVTGARLIPAANSALFGTLETVLGPVWVWLIHGERITEMTLAGGAVVVAAILSHLYLERRHTSS
jgi:drug/metabolite transporter (DMT)-like permease